MEAYLPFLVRHWRTLAAVGLSLATGVILEKLKNTATTSPSLEKSKQSSKLIPVRKEAADDDQEEDQEDQQDSSSDHDILPRIPYQYARPSAADSIRRSAEFYQRMNQRRSVRSISSDPVPLEIIQNIIKAGGMHTKRMFYVIILWNILIK